MTGAGRKEGLCANSYVLVLMEMNRWGREDRRTETRGWSFGPELTNLWMKMLPRGLPVSFPYRSKNTELGVAGTELE